MKIFDRETFFNNIRVELFGGSLNQSQVDGMNAILDAWEEHPRSEDLRWLSYPLATTFHETGSEMQPIEEYGKGAGMSYGEPDPVTGLVYYGRGFVQLTWADNYKRCDEELGFKGEESCYLHPARQLVASVAAETMFQGMVEGWFRSDANGPHTLGRYFNIDTGVDNPYGAREIINGDKSRVPEWSNGISIGNLVASYHRNFLAALIDSTEDALAEKLEKSAPAPEPATIIEITLILRATGPVTIEVNKVQVQE